MISRVEEKKGDFFKQKVNNDFSRLTYQEYNEQKIFDSTHISAQIMGNNGEQVFLI
jgi:hypothetical protein